MPAGRVDQTAHRQQEAPVRNAPLSRTDEFVVKTFSAGTAALQLAGRSAQETAGAHQGPLTEEERELIKRQIDCRRRLIIMKSRNAEAEDPSGRTVIPQEDLQEWLDNLQLRLHQACLTPARQTGGPSERAKTDRPTRHSVTFAPGTLSVPSSTSKSSNSSSSPEPPPASWLKLGQGPATNSTMHPLLTRPRSISVITDQAAAALTDGNYIEQLQVSLQQASVSSLHERLQERKTSSVHPTLLDQLTNQKSASGVRAKAPMSPTKTKTRKKSTSQLPLLPDKFGPSASAGHQPSRQKGHKKHERPKTGVDETESMLSLSSSASTRSLDHLLARQQARGEPEEKTVPDGASNNRPLTHSSPVPGRSRQFAPRDFFDSGQTVDDIYIAAEHLLLPPARREALMSEPTPTIQTETVIQVQKSSPDEEIQMEDFWGAMPDY